MTRDDLRRVVLEELGDIAPEAELDTLADDADIREALDLDSIDVLNFTTALHERLDVEIPDRDQREMLTVDGCLAYLGGKLGVAA